jgi:hypothetical protein
LLTEAYRKGPYFWSWNVHIHWALTYNRHNLKYRFLALNFEYCT